MPTLSAPVQLPARFWAKVEKTDGCWLWTGSTVPPSGYGKTYYEREYWLAHRLSYAASRGPIPEGLEVDHLCKVRLCVRPDHLEAVTARENTKRADSPTGHNARQTHCQDGHEFTPENTYVYASHGGRRCRTCAQAYRRERTTRERTTT